MATNRLPHNQSAALPTSMSCSNGVWRESGREGGREGARGQVWEGDRAQRGKKLRQCGVENIIKYEHKIGRKHED